MASNTPVDLFDEEELLDYGYGPEAMHGEPVHLWNLARWQKTEVDNNNRKCGEECRERLKLHRQFRVDSEG